MTTSLFFIAHHHRRNFDSTGRVKESRKAFVHYPANTFPNQDKELHDDTHFSN